MKKPFLMAIAAMALASCTSEVVPTLEKEMSAEPVAKAESAQIHGIRNYLTKTHKGTRAGDYQLLPYVEDGDTIMYIAQYADGWELFSNSFTAPMSLMKCETGQFREAIAQANPAFLALYDGMVAALKENKTEQVPDTLPGAEQWRPFRSVPQNPNQPGNNNPVYTQVGAKTYPAEHQIIPHMLKTKWDQDDPFNRFMPRQEYKTTEHILTGCAAVALGQLMYYTHYKWNLPLQTPGQAFYDADKNKYTFSAFSSGRWDKMFLTYYSLYDNSVPLLLGWIADYIEVDPKYDKDGNNISTSATLENAEKFIKAKIASSARIEKYNGDKVAEMLKMGKPVFLRLRDKDQDNAGHAVIVDDLDYITYNTDYYYAYVTPQGGSASPDKPVGPDTGTTDDYNYLVSKYGTIYTERQTSHKIIFRFNWGYGGHNDGIDIDSNAINIVVGNINYEMHKIITYNVTI